MDCEHFVLQKLETDSVLLKKDLAFKDSQVKEYEMMLTSLRENNRQQQVKLHTSFQGSQSQPETSPRAEPRMRWVAAAALCWG